ncbi:MAG: hypothetical protein NT061_13245 [Spirochaetes bacterium]|nr:hypothetical protein [Spirochaetota bacterium]
MKIFVPSWQKPGTWLANLEVLDGEAWIEGVELLFFSWDKETRRLFAGEAERIAAYQDRFAFSLHLPDPFGPDVADLVAATSVFVERYVFHPWDDGQAGGHVLGQADGLAEELADERHLKRFRDWCATLDELFSAYGHDRFSMEYTGAEVFGESSAFLHGVSICADTGRLTLDGIDPAAWITERVGSIREVHLHGAGEGRDHLSLSGKEPWLPALLGLVSNLDCIVDLETFDLEATKASFEALKRWIA